MWVLWKGYREFPRFRVNPREREVSSDGSCQRGGGQWGSQCEDVVCFLKGFQPMQEDVRRKME